MKITHRKITASTDNFDVFMLMGYWPGDSGMESDDFYCYGKFFARNLQDAKQQLERCIKKYPEIDASGMYVSEYNEYFDDFDPGDPNFDPYDVTSNEVFNNLDTLFNYIFTTHPGVDDPDLPFSSTDIMSSESIDIEDSKDYIKANGNSLRDEIYNKAIEVMMSPNFGFDKSEAEAYTFVETYPSDDGDATVVELRAELSYEGMMDLTAACDPIVEKYDNDAYFEMEEPGIAVAYVSNQYIESASYGGAYDIEDDMFFNKDEIVEWADKVVAEFNNANDENYRVEDVYFANSTDLVLEAGNSDTSFIATVKVDMRRIRRASDIDKYIQSAVYQLQQSYDEFYKDIEAGTAINADDSTPIDEENLVDEKKMPADDYIVADLDNVEVHVDNKSNITFTDTEYTWANDIDTYSSVYPDVQLDTLPNVIDNIIDVIESYIPGAEGTYKITSQVMLAYDVEGIFNEITDVWETDRGSDYLSETNTDDANIQFNFRKSYVDDIRVDEV